MTDEQAVSRARRIRPPDGWAGDSDIGLWHDLYAHAVISDPLLARVLRDACADLDAYGYVTCDVAAMLLLLDAQDAYHVAAEALEAAEATGYGVGVAKHAAHAAWSRVLLTRALLNRRTCGAAPDDLEDGAPPFDVDSL